MSIFQTLSFVSPQSHLWSNYTFEIIEYWDCIGHISFQKNTYMTWLNLKILVLKWFIGFCQASLLTLSNAYTDILVVSKYPTHFWNTTFNCKAIRKYHTLLKFSFFTTWAVYFCLPHCNSIYTAYFSLQQRTLHNQC